MNIRILWLDALSLVHSQHVFFLSVLLLSPNCAPTWDGICCSSIKGWINDDGEGDNDHQGLGEGESSG